MDPEKSPEHVPEAVSTTSPRPQLRRAEIADFDRTVGMTADSPPPFLKYFGLFQKHRSIILSIIGASVTIGFVATFVMPRKYTSSTTLQIDREPARILRQEMMYENSTDPQFYVTQYELLKSRALAERVVSVLSLADNPEIVEKPSIVSRALGALFSGKDDADSEGIQRVRQAIDAVQKMTIVQPVPLSRIVKISVTSKSRELSQQISSALADGFVAMTLDRRFNSSSYARHFLEERLQQVKVKLEEAERSVVDYAQKQGIVNVDDKISVSSANLKSLNDALAVATAERIKQEQLSIQAQQSDGTSLPQVLADDSIQKARDKRLELMAAYQDKLGVLKPDYPEMRQLKAQIAEYDRQIKGQIDLIKRSLKSSYEAIRNQELSLSAKTEELKKEVLDLRERSIQYTILQREVDTSRSLYDGLLQQYKEVGITGSVGTNNVSVIDRAELPKRPSSPNLLLNLAFALVAGLLTAAAVLAILEYLDDTFKVPEEVEEALGVSVLGVIPRYQTDNVDGRIANAVLADPQCAPAEAFRSLRTSLQFSTASGAPQILLVTSSRPGEGKTTTSVCIAANFAQLGYRVLLIDADLRRPALHKVLGVGNDIGLTNVLTGKTDVSGIITRDVIQGVTFMASGPLPPNPAELLAGDRLSSLLDTARQSFDIVVIDGPPVMGLADAPLLSSLVDGTLLVIDSAETRRRLVKATVKRLQFSRSHIIGAVLNRYDAKNVTHSYGYSYGYGADLAYDYYGYGGSRQLPEKS